MIVLGILLFLCELLFGSVAIPLKSILKSLSGEKIKDTWSIILWQSRMPRALAALLCGAALAVSGLMMQTLFRNPLAGPYILGISAGASLGVALLVVGTGALGFAIFHSGVSIVLAAALGSSAVLLLLFLVSLRVNDVMTLLIIGVLLGSITTAIISVLQYLGPSQAVKSLVLWGMGSVSQVSYSNLFYMGIFSLIGLIGAFIMSKPLNLLLLGENYARSLGQKVLTVRIITMLLAGLLAACVTAYCGPIGFVGIVVPHLSRMLIKNNDHKFLIPFTVLVGINCLLLSDLISRLPGNDLTLPLNAITALIGIPVIVWIILKQHKLTGVF